MSNRIDSAIDWILAHRRGPREPCRADVSEDEMRVYRAVCLARTRRDHPLAAVLRQVRVRFVKRADALNRQTVARAFSKLAAGTDEPRSLHTVTHVLEGMLCFGEYAATPPDNLAWFMAHVRDTVPQLWRDTYAVRLTPAALRAVAAACETAHKQHRLFTEAEAEAVAATVDESKCDAFDLSLSLSLSPLYIDSACQPTTTTTATAVARHSSTSIIAYACSVRARACVFSFLLFLTIVSITQRRRHDRSHQLVQGAPADSRFGDAGRRERKIRGQPVDECRAPRRPRQPPTATSGPQFACVFYGCCCEAQRKSDDALQKHNVDDVQRVLLAMVHYGACAEELPEALASFAGYLQQIPELWLAAYATRLTQPVLRAVAAAAHQATQNDRVFTAADANAAAATVDRASASLVPPLF